MRLPDEPRLPFPLNVMLYVVPIMVFAVWAAVLGVGGYLLYLLFTSGVTPEDFGAFFGRIVQGFNSVE